MTRKFRVLLLLWIRRERNGTLEIPADSDVLVKSDWWKCGTLKTTKELGESSKIRRGARTQRNDAVDIIGTIFVAVSRMDVDMVVVMTC